MGPTEESDGACLDRAQQDPDLFGTFYDRHVGLILAFCMRRTGCPETAADLTAETFAAAYARRGSYREPHPGATALPWLYGIARRQIATFHRRRRVATKYRRRLGISEIRWGGDDAMAEVDEAVTAELAGPTLRAALADLPESQEHAVRLRILQNLPYEQVARELGCSEGAALVRVSRGLGRLAALVEDGR
jgi:RNA polymerase sigma-70 factor (ECF subfamily)